MIVGQFGSYINECWPSRAIAARARRRDPHIDPYKCSGAISHINDWHGPAADLPRGRAGRLDLDVRPHDGRRRRAAGQLPTDARSIFEEGIRIPPIKLFERGELQEDVLELIMNNTRTPEMNHSDLIAIIAGCRAGEKRVLDICDRFGTRDLQAGLRGARSSAPTARCAS